MNPVEKKGMKIETLDPGWSFTLDPSRFSLQVGVSLAHESLGSSRFSSSMLCAINSSEAVGRCHVGWLWC